MASLHPSWLADIDTQITFGLSIITELLYFSDIYSERQQKTASFAGISEEEECPECGLDSIVSKPMYQAGILCWILIV